METTPLNFSESEKTILVEALDYLLENMRRCRKLFADSSELLPEINEREELRTKLILAVQPITLSEAHPWDNADSSVCELCGKPFPLNFKYQAVIEFFNADVCNACTEKHAPELYGEMIEKNKVIVHIPEGTKATDDSDSLPF